jgi:hypothetical protein
VQNKTEQNFEYYEILAEFKACLNQTYYSFNHSYVHRGLCSRREIGIHSRNGFGDDNITSHYRNDFTLQDNLQKESADW